MTLALWCVLVAALMPIVFTGVAKAGSKYDNHRPRDSASGLQGYRKRAHAAHQNAFEAFPFFAAAVIVAEMKGAPRGLLDAMATVFVAVRVVYFIVYVSDQASLRSLVWGVGFLLTIAIFVLPLWR